MPQKSLEEKLQCLKIEKEKLEKEDDPTYAPILEKITEAINFKYQITNFKKQIFPFDTLSLGFYLVFEIGNLEF